MDEIIEIDACLTDNDDGPCLKDDILESGTDDEFVPSTSTKVPDKIRISSHDSGIDVTNDPDKTVLYPTEPNMTHVRLELGTRDGSGIYLGTF